MEKRKRKPKAPANQHEFVSPFSLEECVDRVPSGIAHCIDRDTYTFEIKSSINNTRNQFANITVRLERIAENKTLVMGKVHSSKFVVVFTLAVALGFIAILAVPTRSVELGILIASVLVSTVSISHRLSTNALANSLFALFKAIQKTKKAMRRPIVFPWLMFRLSSGLPLNDCAVRLQQLSFKPVLVKIVAVDADEYQFLIRPFGSEWAMLCIWGQLKYTEDYITQVHYGVGAPLLTYLPIALFLTISQGGFNSGVARFFLKFLFSSLLFFLGFILLGGVGNILSIRRTFTKILNP